MIVKKNDATLRYYSFFVYFNPFIELREWAEIEANAQQYFLDFLNHNDYGDDLPSINFNFLVENEIDVNKQDDHISLSTHFGIPPFARLSAHLDYITFNDASDELKYKITLNGILFLLNYWKNNLKVPKGTPLEKIIRDYENRLKNDNLLYAGDVYIKFNKPLKFYFMRHHFYGLNENDILFNTNDIETYLNNNLYKSNFGKSIDKIYFSYDIFDFDEQKEYIEVDKKYKYGRNKDLCIMEQYDSQLLIDKTKAEQIKYLRGGILKAIERIETMKPKPKEFNAKEFYKTIDNLLNKYEI
jgi:hypothetical protein